MKEGDCVDEEIAPLSIQKNMLWNSAGSIINLAAQWLITVLVVRISSGYDAAGLYSLAVTVYGVFAPVAQYRMYTYQISDTKRENTLGEYFTFRIITDVIAFVGCFGYALATCPSSAVSTILLYGVYKSLIMLIDVFHACDQRHQRMDYIGISLTLQGVLSLGLFGLVFAATGNLEATLVAMCLGLVAVGVLYDLRRATQFEKLSLGITIAKTKYLLWHCLPIVLGALACSAAASVPRQFLFTDMGEVALGVYASVAAPVAVIQNGASYIYYPLIGYFADYYVEGNLKRIFALLAKVTAGITLLGVVCAVLIELFGVQVLDLLFANNIVEYAYLLMPMIISALIAAYMWFLNDLLIAVRDFKGNFFGNAASLVAALCCMVPFIMTWDLNGVTFTAIASSVVGIVVMAISFFLSLRKGARAVKVTSEVNEKDSL
ncbi:polysaccharide biosynthesis protein [Eggerthellaceae bacterium zg-893]|nr:polysaccharide biosynthesis protein [Eggerthellaceae bacterium zg-893]